MKIAIASDLHLEFEPITLPNKENARVLILSGDIVTANPLHKFPVVEPPASNVNWKPSENQINAMRYRDFFHHVSNEYEHVVQVAGNHEFYHGNFPDVYDWMREETSKYNNIHFLQDDTVEIDGLVFMGATLWTDMNKGDPATLQLIENMLNDFRLIRNSTHNYRRFLPKDTVASHNKSLAYFDEIITKEPTKQYVVVGHHCPSFNSVNEIYKKDTYMNGAYYSDLSEFMLNHPQIKLWTHGHTHHSFDYMIGSTRIVCNPRGYVGYEPQADSFMVKFIDLITQ
jgi:predicted phosphodiesterase